MFRPAVPSALSSQQWLCSWSAVQHSECWLIVCTFNYAVLFGARLFSGANVYLLKFITLYTKLVPVDVMKVYGNGGTASPVLIVGTRWR
jgi:hypothetical protein